MITENEFKNAMNIITEYIIQSKNLGITNNVFKEFETKKTSKITGKTREEISNELHKYCINNNLKAIRAYNVFKIHLFTKYYDVKINQFTEDDADDLLYDLRRARNCGKQTKKIIIEFFKNQYDIDLFEISYNNDKTLINKFYNN